MFIETLQDITAISNLQRHLNTWAAEVLQELPHWCQWSTTFSHLNSHSGRVQPPGMYKNLL